MVIEEIKEVYRCPYCDKVYEDWDTAQECADECADIELPVDDEITTYTCEICRKVFKKEEEAEDCEYNHKKRYDTEYQEFIYKEKMKVLEEASKHKDQKKVNDFLRGNSNEKTRKATKTEKDFKAKKEGD